ncbi:MAG: hypothetical protein HC890_13900 [Chloroflexaceae bacterium]|nr:hypothetical protein [Chloroflexaceae bacterium]
MTAASELVSLIAKIDRVLAMPVGLLGQGREQQRLVLLEIRQYLAAQALKSPSSEDGSAIAQAVVAGMVERWEDWLTPLKTELLALESQRQALLEEIEQLQQQRQALAPLSSPELIPKPVLEEPEILPNGPAENPTELGMAIALRVQPP